MDRVVGAVCVTVVGRPGSSGCNRVLAVAKGQRTGKCGGVGSILTAASVNEVLSPSMVKAATPKNRMIISSMITML